MASTVPIIIRSIFLEHFLSHYTNFPIIHANSFKLGAIFCKEGASKAPCHIGVYIYYYYYYYYFTKTVCFHD